MSDEAATQPRIAAPADSSVPATAEGTETEPVAPASDVQMDDAEPAETASAPKVEADKPATTEEPATVSPEKPAAEPETDIEMKDAKPAGEPPAEPVSVPVPAENPEATESEAKPETEKRAGAAAAAPSTVQEATGTAVQTKNGTPSGDKNKARRKSSGIPEHKGKKLNKKQSKAKILHTDAKPGDHYFAKLKGFPPWPVIICDDTMLPQSMLSTRPVSAARPDGTYREDFADGGKRIAERTFPVMYLHTNEFGWSKNTELEDLDPTTVRESITQKMRKDLMNAHLLAEEQNSLDHYKQVLQEFEESRLAELEAKAARASAKKDKAKKAEAPPPEEDEDVEMADADEAEVSETKKLKSKKRKAEEDAATPQRSDSVKKPKIKLTTSSTPKATANGVQSPKPGKESAAKPVKVKSKAAKTKDADGKKTEKEVAAPKEPELTPEERRVRKEKEILFLRHRLQKGLLNRDQPPKEEEMKPMSDFLAKLETFPDLEVSIIRATKINKVLKAILKLEGIPKEEEYKFKPRSQTLLDKWNKILASEAVGGPANGVNGTSGEAAAPKADKETTNGVKQNGGTEATKEAPKEPKEEPKDEVKEALPKAIDSASEPAKEEKPAEDATAATTEDPTAVESST